MTRILMTGQTKTVTLAAQLGGPDPKRRTWHPHYDLSSALGRFCKGPYSTEVDEFAIVLRIDGEFQEFGFDGLKYLRRSRKGRYITIDIGIPRNRWEHRTDREIRQHFAKVVREALVACIQRLLKDRTFVNGDALLSDYDKAADEYLRKE